MAGLATISSTSSLDSSANLSLSVAMVNGFLLAPAVCLCEFQCLWSASFQQSLRLWLLRLLHSVRLQSAGRALSEIDIPSEPDKSLSPNLPLNHFIQIHPCNANYSFPTLFQIEVKDSSTNVMSRGHFIWCSELFRTSQLFKRSITASFRLTNQVPFLK